MYQVVLYFAAVPHPLHEQLLHCRSLNYAGINLMLSRSNNYILSIFSKFFVVIIFQNKPYNCSIYLFSIYTGSSHTVVDL